MTEPTRDEINRALAEWDGTGFCSPEARYAEPIPDYCSSLDAQMPIWTRLRAKGYIFALEAGDGYVVVDLYSPSGKSVGVTPFWRDGTSVPEASARALYAVLQRRCEERAPV